MSGIEVSIRPGRPNEVAVVLGVWEAAGSPPSVTDSVEHVRAVIEREGTWLLVAEEQDRIVGTLIAAWDGWRGNLYRLAVLPERRRRGIASALVRAGETRLRAAGARRLAAIVLEEPSEASAFWTAAGYAHQPEAGRFTKTDVDLPTGPG